MRAIRRFTVRPVLPEPLLALGDLTTNLRWSWSPEAQDVFEAMDPEIWRETGRDPVKTLGALSTRRLDELAADASFLQMLGTADADLQQYLTGEHWFQQASAREGGESLPKAIAYFSPEYGISSVLPQYSGGLGILAGDHLKTASDLGVPLVGVGLLYQFGYFRQQFSREGWQLESYAVLDPDGLPITLLRESDGTPAHVRISVPGEHELTAHVFVAQVGRVPLLLLDTDFEENPEPLRGVTDRLYGGTTEHRLLQELLLGVGGVRALRAFSRITGAAEPEVYHTNEGHAGFLGLERIRELTADETGPGLDFDAAVEITRAGTVFTTHTPVPAGIDRFPLDLMAQYFGSQSPVPGVPTDRILRLGAEDFHGGDAGVFNMAVMGFRLAQRANGVSRLHGEVSRGMFSGLWPAFDQAEVPITSITNGVHAPTWVAREVFDLAKKQGADTSSDAAEIWSFVDKVPSSDLWSTKRELRKRLVEDARGRLRKSWLKRGASPAELGWTRTALDPDVLTIGFARRAASYKRLTLMLRDPERLKRLLLHPERPIQLIMAGKAHPADDGGKKLIQAIVHLADDPEVRHRVAYLPNYDIAMAQPLYPGCDVWLNNPLRPYEACGTSGMKAALNGGLNLSILDGWWDEWYDGSNGWAIPSADGVEDPDKRDDLEAGALYDLIENDVAPRFYDLDETGVPTRWIEMVRHTLKSLGPKVLSTRMVREYVNLLYAPAAVSSRAMNDSYAGASELAAWKSRVVAGWSGVHIDHVETEGLSDSPEIGGDMELHAFVSLGALSPDDVDVEVVHGRVKGEDQLVDTTSTALHLGETYEAGRHRFDGHLRLSRAGSFGYTVRILPKHDALASPAELGLVVLA